MSFHKNKMFLVLGGLHTIKTFLAIAAQNRWRIYQMDGKYAFLNGYLEEEVYV